jgi:hypothetical protein
MRGLSDTVLDIRHDIIRGRAACRPARVLSRIRSRSNSTKARKTWKMN